jgi:type VI secretion system secreted protein VgrG
MAHITQENRTLFTQENRTMSITTPLGEGVLLLAGFSGGEALSRLFSYQLDLLSETESIDPTQIVGKNVTWQVQHLNHEPRYFNGYVSRFSSSATLLRNVRAYKAEVVPQLWFLTRKSDCRIFQNKTVEKIIEQLFEEFGITDTDGSLSGDHPTREYCVQYRETAFDFISRLMEQEGIFYYFRHDKGKHTLFLRDAVSGYDMATENELHYAPTNRRGSCMAYSWDHQFSFRSGKWTQTDYNFERPSTDLLTSTPTVIPLPDAKEYELFDYPGEYGVKRVGDAQTKVRMEEEEVTYEVVTATSGSTTLSPGSKFTLVEHPVEDEKGKKYVVTAVQHVATETAYNNSSRPGDYSNSFTAIPSTTVFRPARLTVKPLVQGPQPAVVVGPIGEEIYTDKYGRIKVQFFWDRLGKKDENSSCFIRVGQVWAGKRWGASFWPRIGQEVIVDFLEGDPDRPLVVGSVYNAEQMPPYQGGGPDGKHASDKLVSGIKTSTHGGNGFNELRFDDNAATAQVFIHGERNMDVRVQNDSMTNVRNDYHLTIGEAHGDQPPKGDQKEKVCGNKHLHVKRDQIERIGGNMELLIGGETNPGHFDVSIKADHKTTIAGDEHRHIKQARKEEVVGNQSLTVGGHLQEKVNAGYAIEANTIYLKAETTMVLEAGMRLSLKVGGDFVDLGPSGVSINGSPAVMINSGGSAGSGSGPKPEAPTDAKEASPTDPKAADDSKPGSSSRR